MHRARKIDANQGEIVKVFRSLGCRVWITAALGDGGPDLVVSRGKNVVLVEIKDGSLPPSKRKLTKDEERFRADWKAVYYVVETVEQAIMLAQALEG